MTREEQIVEYANSFKGKGIESDELKEIIRLAIIDGAKWADAHPRESSLPDNLDDVAREIVIKMHPCLADCTILGDRLTRGQLMALVKAGAEWMAKQINNDN